MLDKVSQIIRNLDRNLYLENFLNPDGVFIIAFLRGCKYSFDKTKKKIDTWHTVRTHAPDTFGGWDLDDPKIKYLVELG